MTLPVWITTGETVSQEVLTYALIDSQSDSSYITEELASRMKIPYEETSTTQWSSAVRRHSTNLEIDSSSPSQVLDKLRAVLVVYYLSARRRNCGC